MTWKPINTAPKDGRSLLLFVPPDILWPERRIVGRWCELQRYTTWSGVKTFHGWSAGEYQDRSDENPVEIFPSRWTELPAPPDDDSDGATHV